MKYDASMAQFHGDIVAAVRLMCGKDTDARSNSEGASPAPLRDYLKERYGYNGRSANGVRYLNTPSKGMEIKLDREVGNGGDTSITLSWSQVAKFIRDNPSEIFGEEDKPGNAENSPSIEILDLDVRTFNAMKRAGINTLADVERLADYSLNHTDGLTLSDAHRETIEAFKTYRDSQAQQKTDFPCEDCGYDEKGCCNYPETPDDYCVCGDKQIPKSKGTYLEIFKEHYPNVDCDQLYGDYCPGDFFEGAMDSMCNACTNICKNCWSANAHEEWCETVDSVPEGWKAVEPEHEEEEQSDEEFNRTKEELEKFISSVDEKKMDCPHWVKGKTLNNKGFGVIEFECAMHKESFFEEGKIKHFLTTHCYNQIWCPFCNHPEAAQGKPVEPPAPAQSETAVVFDYSELDTDTAAKLESLTAEIFNVRKEYIFTMAKKVAYAHDLLANHYGGKFGAWCESIGISRDTGNNMVRVAELFGNSTEIERQNLEKLTDGNVKLLYEAARPSAPAELVEAVKSGDITTHKEYIALKKQLEEAEQKVDKLRENNQKMRTENIAALVRADKAEKQLEQSESRNRQFDESFKNIEAASKANYEKYLEELHKNQDLQVQIRKLEERPVEVAVEQDTAAIAERDERIAELEEQLRSRDSELDFGNNNASCDKMSEFYEMLHGKALNALKDCMAFIRSDDLPQIVKNRAVGRFGTLKDLIEMYIDELEE